MQLKLYRWLIYLASPLIDLYLMHRKHRGKEDASRFPERLGRASIPRPSGPIVWIHAASIGESVSVLPLIHQMLGRYPAIHILLTTGTVTSAQMLHSRLPNRCFHQYVPIDRLVSVHSFLEHWKPDVALWVEAELWPNLIIETRKTGCTMIHINARISDASFDTWSKARSLAERMLKCFSLTLTQSAEDVQKFRMLGAPHVKHLGNLKFDAPALPNNPKEVGHLLNMIGERPLWAAVSTHPGEETVIAATHLALAQQYQNVLTIIVPRHPNRCDEIVRDITAIDPALNIAIRSRGEAIQNHTGIYIADTIGELGIFYRLSGIAFIGGSLVPHGGQNPLEAARLECAIITGPHVSNFVEIYRTLLKEGAALQIHDKESLYAAVNQLLKHPKQQDALSTAALEILESQHGIIHKYLNEMHPLLNMLSPKSDVSDART